MQHYYSINWSLLELIVTLSKFLCNFALPYGANTNSEGKQRKKT